MGLIINDIELIVRGISWSGVALLISRINPMVLEEMKVIVKELNERKKR